MWYKQGMSETDARARAERRRREYAGVVVTAGTPKPALYDELSLLERLAHMTALTQRLAVLSKTAETPRPRAEWPGEIRRLERP
jgi:hypothetical protein